MRILSVKESPRPSHVKRSLCEALTGLSTCPLSWCTCCHPALPPTLVPVRKPQVLDLVTSLLVHRSAIFTKTCGEIVLGCHKVNGSRLGLKGNSE